MSKLQDYLNDKQANPTADSGGKLAAFLNSNSAAPSEQDSGALTRGLKTGSGGILQTAGRLTGSETLSDYGTELVQGNQSKIQGLSDIPSNAGAFIGETAGELGADIVGQSAATATGAGIGLLTSPVTGPVGPLVGAAIGRYGYSFARSYDSIKQQQEAAQAEGQGEINELRAILGATVSAGLDFIGPVSKTAGKIGEAIFKEGREKVIKELTEAAPESLIKYGLKATGKEAVTELGQEEIESLAGSGEHLGLDEAGLVLAKGGLGGATVGVAEGAYGQSKASAVKRKEEAAKAQAKALEAKTLRGLKPARELDPQDLIDAEAEARKQVSEYSIEMERRAKSESLVAGLREPTPPTREPLALEYKPDAKTPKTGPNKYGYGVAREDDVGQGPTPSIKAADESQGMTAIEASPIRGYTRTPAEVSLEAQAGQTQLPNDEGGITTTLPDVTAQEQQVARESGKSPPGLREPAVGNRTRTYLDEKGNTILTGPKAGSVAKLIPGIKQVPNKPGFFTVPNDKKDDLRNLLDPNMPVDTEVKPLTRTKDEQTTPELGENLSEINDTYQGSDGAFSYGVDSKINPANRKDVEGLTSIIGKGWAKQPDFVIHDSLDAPEVPSYIKKGAVKGKTVGGYHDRTTGKTHLFLDGHKSLSEVVSTIYHEEFGHKGAQVWGSNFTAVLDEVVRSQPKLLAAKMKQYKLDGSRDSQLEAAEEVLAELGETSPNLTVVNKAVIAVREYFRKKFPNMEYFQTLSKSEILKKFVIPARNYIKKGKEAEFTPTLPDLNNPKAESKVSQNPKKLTNDSKPIEVPELKAPKLTDEQAAQLREDYSDSKKRQLSEKDPYKLTDIEQEIQFMEDRAAMTGTSLHAFEDGAFRLTDEDANQEVNEIVGQGYGFVRKTLRSSADTLKKTKGLEKLGEAIVDLVDNSQKNRGLFNKELNVGMKALESLERKDRLEVEDQFEKLITARQDGDTTTVEDIYSNAKPELRQLVDAVDAAFRQAGSLMEKLKIMVHNPVTGKFHPFKGLENFFPNIMKAEYREALIRPMDADGNPTEKFKELAQHLIDAEQKYADEDNNEQTIETIEDALHYVKIASDLSNFESGFFGNIERSRTLPFPPAVYDYSLASVHKYRERWAERVAQIEAFGQEVRPLGKQDLFQQTLAKILGKGDPRAVQVEQLRNIIYGDRQHYSTIQKAAQVSSTVATGLQISGPLSVLKNFLGGITNVTQFVDVSSFTKGMSEMMDSDSRAAAFEIAHNLGVISDDFLRSIADMEIMGLSQKEGWARVQKTVSALTAEAMSMRRLGALKHISFNSSEAFVRVISSLGAKHQLTKWIAAHESNANSRSSKVFRKFAKDEGIDIAALMKEDGFNNLEESPQTSRFVRRMVNRLQGSYRQDQVPAFLDSDWGKFLFKYTKYGWQLGRMFDKTVVENIQSGDPDLVKEGAQNFVKFLGVYSTMGYLSAATIKAVFGSELIPDWKEIFETLKDKDGEELEQVAYLMKLMGTSMQFMGAFGPISIAVDRYNQWMEHGDNPLSAPGLSVFINLGTQLAKFIRGSQDLDGMTVGGESAEWLINQLAPTRQGLQAVTELTGKPGLLARQRTVTKSRELVRRFAKSTGLVDLKSGVGARIPSIHNILNDKINNALLMGDGDKALEIYERAEKNPKIQKELDSLKAAVTTSINNRRPMAINGSPGGMVGIELFDEWAQKHLSTEDYNRIKKLDDEYMEAAYDSGLIKPVKQKALNKAMREYEKGQESIEE